MKNENAKVYNVVNAKRDRGGTGAAVRCNVAVYFPSFFYASDVSSYFTRYTHGVSTYDTLDQIVYGFIAAAIAPSACFTAICLLGVLFNFSILRLYNGIVATVSHQALKCEESQ